jgi:hypothetical protein
MAEPKHIEFGRLADWVEGRLPEEEARMIEEQVSEAGEATLADLAWLRAFSRVSEETVIEAPPQAVHDELIRRFEVFAEGARPPGFLERLTAVLAPGSGVGAMQPAFGMRSAGFREAQGQLVYATDAADVALNFRPRPGGLLDLDGQVLPNDDMGVEPGAFGVQILDAGSGGEVDVTATDDLGEFAFEGLAPGEYQIVVSGERWEILISPVQLS